MLGQHDDLTRLVEAEELQVGILVRYVPFGFQPGQGRERIGDDGHIRDVVGLGGVDPRLPGLAELEVCFAHAHDEALHLGRVHSAPHGALAVLAQQLGRGYGIQQGHHVALFQLGVGPLAVGVVLADEQSQHRLLTRKELQLGDGGLQPERLQVRRFLRNDLIRTQAGGKADQIVQRCLLGLGGDGGGHLPCAIELGERGGTIPTGVLQHVGVYELHQCLILELHRFGEQPVGDCRTQHLHRPGIAYADEAVTFRGRAADLQLVGLWFFQPHGEGHFRCRVVEAERFQVLAFEVGHAVGPQLAQGIGKIVHCQAVGLELRWFQHIPTGAAGQLELILAHLALNSHQLRRIELQQRAVGHIQLAPAQCGGGGTTDDAHRWAIVHAHIPLAGWQFLAEHDGVRLRVVLHRQCQGVVSLIQPKVGPLGGGAVRSNIHDVELAGREHEIADEHRIDLEALGLPRLGHVVVDHAVTGSALAFDLRDLGCIEFEQTAIEPSECGAVECPQHGSVEQEHRLVRPIDDAGVAVALHIAGGFAHGQGTCGRRCAERDLRLERRFVEAMLEAIDGAGVVLRCVEQCHLIQHRQKVEQAGWGLEWPTHTPDVRRVLQRVVFSTADDLDARNLLRGGVPEFQREQFQRAFLQLLDSGRVQQEHTATVEPGVGVGLTQAGRTDLQHLRLGIAEAEGDRLSGFLQTVFGLQFFGCRCIVHEVRGLQAEHFAGELTGLHHVGWQHGCAQRPTRR